MSGPGTGWQETYLGGTEEAERALLATVLPKIGQIRDTAASRQRADVRRAFPRALGERVERMEAFSPWVTPCLRPLGRSNRARREAYERSAKHRGAPVEGNIAATAS